MINNSTLNINQKRPKLFLFFIGISFLLHAQITPKEAVVQMQKGINLGNTMEPPREAGWNNPRAEEYYFDMYKDAGFQLVRIPVRWDNYTSKTEPFKVSDSWMDRVEQIVDWGLERGLFIVINAHHDNWIKENYTTINKARFDSIWTQISIRFKDKPEKLIFEVLNEPHGLSKANNDDMHARILSIIRKTNPTRIVILQGNEWGGSDQLLKMAIPDDDYIIGSFHSYDPYLFGLEGKGTWGTGGDISVLDAKFKSVANWSEQNNIPAFIGEFGALKTCEYNSRMKHYRTYTILAQKYGIASAAWDDGGDFRIMERQQKKWNEIKDILIKTTEKSPWLLTVVHQDSIIRIRWNNYVHDHDSIIIQKRSGNQSDFTNIATLKADTSLYHDIRPAMEQYHTYRVIAHYNDTSDLFSHPSRVFFPAWEKKVRAPFNAAPALIPGIIEAEDFDFGGEGLAYHDMDKSNVAGDYRPNESVDVYDRLGDGYHIGNAIAGEWYTYSVDVKTEGWYDISFHLAALYGGGTFQLEVDTCNSEILSAPTCYSWLHTKVVSTKMYLYSGKQIAKFKVLSEPLFNIDKIVFDLKTGNSNKKIRIEKPFICFQNNYGELVVQQTRSNHLKQINLYSISGSLVTTVYNPEFLSKIVITQPGLYIIHGISEKGKYAQKIVFN